MDYQSCYSQKLTGQQKYLGLKGHQFSLTFCAAAITNCHSMQKISWNSTAAVMWTTKAAAIKNCQFAIYQRLLEQQISSVSRTTSAAVIMDCQSAVITD
jgi:hypothetical protein